MTTNELSTNANLDLLAQRINAEHGAARGAFTKGFEHAVKAGELLIEAKAAVEHGQWVDMIGVDISRIPIIGEVGDGKKRRRRS